MPAADVRGPEPDGLARNPDRVTDLPPAHGAQAGQNGTEQVAAGPKAGTHQEHNAAAGESLVDPDLLDLVTRWDRLPESVRAAILAIVRASS